MLPVGRRLPAERALAAALSVSRNTVTSALDELRAEGRLESIQGSGTRVVGPAAPTSSGTRVADHLTSGPGIDLAKAEVPDLSHLPSISIEMWQLDAACGGAAVNAAGLPVMRQSLADLFTRGGTTGRPRPTGAAQVHVTAGSHQATALLLSTLAARGQRVAVAEHSYPGIFDILDALELHAVGVHLDDAGMVPTSLDEVLRRERPVAVFHQSGPQIPSGQVTPSARARAIAEVVDRHRMPVIEDTTVAAVAFDGVAPMLADHCRVAEVMSTGSLSKTCWGGLRIGWLRAPESIVHRTVHRHLGSDLGPSIPSQLLALELLPHLDEIAAVRRRRLEVAVDGALAQLVQALPDVAVDRPSGGSLLWARFPVADTAALVAVARQHGVRVAPGSIHAVGRTPGPYVRIDVDRPAELVREGIDRLARAWHDLTATTRAALATQSSSRSTSGWSMSRRGRAFVER